MRLEHKKASIVTRPSWHDVHFHLVAVSVGDGSRSLRVFKSASLNNACNNGRELSYKLIVGVTAARYVRVRFRTLKIHLVCIKTVYLVFFVQYEKLAQYNVSLGFCVSMITTWYSLIKTFLRCINSL